MFLLFGRYYFISCFFSFLLLKRYEKSRLLQKMVGRKPYLWVRVIGNKLQHLHYCRVISWKNKWLIGGISGCSKPHDSCIFDTRFLTPPNRNFWSQMTHLEWWTYPFSWPNLKNNEPNLYDNLFPLSICGKNF